MSWYSDAGRFSSLQRWKDWEIEIIHSSNKGYYGGYGLINIGTHKVNDMFKLAGPCRSVVSQATTNGCHITPHDVRQSLGGMGTIVGQHITATLQFDRNVTATLLHDQFSPINVDGSVMEWYGSHGRLVRHTDRAWFYHNRITLLTSGKTTGRL